MNHPPNTVLACLLIFTRLFDVQSGLLSSPTPEEQPPARSGPNSNRSRRRTRSDLAVTGRRTETVGGAARLAIVEMLESETGRIELGVVGITWDDRREPS